MEALSPELQNVVNEIASENKIKNFTIEATKAVSGEGDGYIGIINGLSVIDKDSNKKLNLVVKTAPTNENLRKQFPTRKFFLREICMYDEIIPDLLKFQEEYNVPNPFNSIAKFYGSISDELKETLLLENLKEDGYQMYKRQDPLDSHHLSLVLSEYAKFHALSLAMRKLQPERFEKIREIVGEDMKKEFDTDNKPHDLYDSPEMKSKIADGFFGSTLKALRNKPKELEAVKKFIEDCFQFMFTSQADEYSVVSHGDCWCANLLFKYEDEDRPKIPTKLRIIDWQISLVSTPVHDVSFFFYLCAERDDLENYMRYLHVYHTALSEALKAFGLDPEEVYSFELFEEQWKTKSKIGFLRTILMMEQSLSEGKTHDFEDIANEGQIITGMNNIVKEPSELFKQRMGDLVEFLIRYNFI